MVADTMRAVYRLWGPAGTRAVTDEMARERREWEAKLAADKTRAGRPRLAGAR